MLPRGYTQTPLVPHSMSMMGHSPQAPRSFNAHMHALQYAILKTGNRTWKQARLKIIIYTASLHTDFQLNSELTNINDSCPLLDHVRFDEMSHSYNYYTQKPPLNERNLYDLYILRTIINIIVHTCCHNDDVSSLCHDGELLWWSVTVAHGCRGITSTIAMKQRHQSKP